MSKVAADLDSLIAFRSHLMQFNGTLAEEFSSMRSHHRQLGEVWNDAKYHQFGQALEEVSKGIERYLAVTEDHESHLLHLIRALEDYGRWQI